MKLHLEKKLEVKDWSKKLVPWQPKLTNTIWTKPTFQKFITNFNFSQEIIEGK